MTWWESDEYNDDRIIPVDFENLAGPRGVGCVKLYDSGKTDPGWGLSQDKAGRSFVENYAAGRFNEQIALVGAISKRWNFAFIMRSMRIVCIDIDGKNGGLENVGKLGNLPVTLAETSRSGDGYHLFYETQEEWDQDKGFALFRDRIGIVPGVDIKAVGCVFHYETQRWNHRSIAPLSDYLKATWLAKENLVEQQVTEIIQLLDAGDEDALLVIQSNLRRDLDKKIPAGRRNNTLFAIGNQMKHAGVQDWPILISGRAAQLGLDQDEIVKLVKNIEKYGSKA